MKSSLTQGLAVLDGVYTRFLSLCRGSVWAVGLVTTLATGTQAQELPSQSLTTTPSDFSQVTVLVDRPSLRPGSRGTEVSELQAMLQLLGYYAGPVDGVYNNSTAIAVSQFQTAAGLAADGVVGPATWERLFPIASSPNSSEDTPASTTTASAAAFPVPAIANQPQPSQPTLSPSVRSSNDPPADPPSTASPSPQTFSTELPVLRLGMRGSSVNRLQEQLQRGGWFQGAVDGVFGPETQAAVKAAQQQYQLEVDGIVGPATWQALLNL